MPRTGGDYSRVEDYLSEIGDEIEFEYGEPWDDLSDRDREQVLLDKFFKGNKEYTDSARQLNIGLKEIEGHPVNFKEKEFTVGHITRGGREHTILRDSDGRIRRWVRD